jgi:hypothetical protein
MGPGAAVHRFALHRVRGTKDHITLTVASS